MTVSVEHIEKCWKPIEIIIHDDSSDEELLLVEEDENYYVILVVTCHDDNGDEKCINIIAMFRDEDQFNLANDESFDFYIEHVNAWLNEFNPGFFVDDTIECADILADRPDCKNILDLRFVGEDEC